MRKREVITGRKYTFKHTRWLYLIAGILVIPALFYAFQNGPWHVGASEPAADFDNEKTSQYIANFDPRRYENQGSDYDNPIYFPESIGVTQSEVDLTYDYNFDRLAKVEASLKGVDRPRALKYIFDTVTKGATNDKERHLAVLRFLQKSGYHNSLWQPTYPDKVTVFDPLVLLELGEMRCGHIATLAADLFDAAGYQTRRVQLSSHVVTEIFYGGDWHYFDADVFGGGEIVLDAEGDIPSVAELSHADYRYRIDSLAANYLELITFPRKYGPRYPSYYYFSKNAYTDYLPSYYTKTASEEEADNYLYGWNYYDTTIADDIELSEAPDYFVPGAVAFTSIQINEEQGSVTIEWSPANDADHDLLGYRVFISNSPRGWNYLTFNGPDELRSFWSATPNRGWDPAMYDQLFKIPPHEVGLIQTESTSVHFSLKRGIPYYVTVMPYDAHGESVGKKLYYMSNEIKVSLDQ
jgi:hypothetical protein